MNYCALKPFDVANGTGVRVSLFVSGCRHHCKGCFNPESWCFDYGELFDDSVCEKIYKMLEPAYIEGITLLGGEPMEPENQRVLLPFLKELRARLPQKNIWCYTGCVVDRDLQAESSYRCEYTDEMLSLIDVIVDGEFVLEKKNISLRFRGSENQRILHKVNDKWELATHLMNR